MTREELIDHLEHLADYVKYSEDAPALREVIKMLTETRGERTETHACDCISRREAIEALFDWEMTYDWDDHCREEDPKPAYIVSPSDVIEHLPSAQPDLDEWCTDCKEYDQDKHCCPRWNRVIRETLKDAQLERKTGKWIERNPQNSDKCRLIECSECGDAYIVDFGIDYEDWIEGRNFCRRCGADLRGEADDR